MGSVDMSSEASKGTISLQSGVRELILGVDDELLKRPKRSIPRADVAELAVQSLILPEAENRYAPLRGKPLLKLYAMPQPVGYASGCEESSILIETVCMPMMQVHRCHIKGPQ